MTIYEIFNKAANNWNQNKGIGTAFIPPPLDSKCMVLVLLTNMYSNEKNKGFNTLIITDTFNQRTELIEYLTSQESEENNNEFKELIKNKHLMIVSKGILDKFTFCQTNALLIVYGITELTEHIVKRLRTVRWKLVILNKLLSPNDTQRLYTYAPLLDDFKQNEIDELRTSIPIEDNWIDVALEPNSQDDKLLNYYNEYIATSLNIFGSFDIMNQCRLGNQQLNISAVDICYSIATENGWNEHLDMSSELNRDIDNLYNPANIRQRATETFEMIRNRGELLASNKSKLPKILQIIEDNPDKKILIISKKGIFASTITEYINSNNLSPICGNYHDYVEPIEAEDVYGNPIYIKSGKNKGERKVIMAQAQKSLNEQKFNLDRLKVLSTSNAPDKALTAKIDIVIITSPLCESIESYLYRLSNLRFNEKLILFSLYVKNSLEEQKLMNKDKSPNHKVNNSIENNIIIENNSDFIIVD